MTILLINLVGKILIVALQPPGHGALSRRLVVLRAWPSQRNRPPRQ